MSFSTSQVHAEGNHKVAVKLIYNFKREGKKFKFQDVECCNLCDFTGTTNDVLEEVLRVRKLNNYLHYKTNTTDFRRYHLDLEQLYTSDFNKDGKIISIDKQDVASLDVDLLYENVIEKC